MNFRPRTKEEPEINLIPFIDVLLVILIFLMLTTTYSKSSPSCSSTLPVADAEQQRDYPKEIVVAIAADGRYAINKAAIDGKGVDSVVLALQQAAQAGSVVIISADATAPHQSVITVMEAARRVGLTQITFATQSAASAGADAALAPVRVCLWLTCCAMPGASVALGKLLWPVSQLYAAAVRRRSGVGRPSSRHVPMYR